ncbi:TIGR04282 family arsenosugar biosynthesis glycosyltransferase [Brumimicrobium oceani]|uniref:Glycosyltransferase n=1 Tax=Brumimicrobium oceani TaxID=2100725 RepID=A0A2U2XHN9_9FLAO|nr:TIGR04282 family arsenosugar biosynthesis glycosyltransferase [Brumimicrobium oceani]PWH87231.1 glycosyltransferase [Brumimicrobium oceani]
MNSKNALIIMTKNPELGKCKTRLAKTLGDEKALEIYVQLIDYTAKIAKASKADLFIYSTDTLVDRKRWESPQTYFSIQSKGDLGQRMSTAIENIKHQGYEKVIVLGSDCAEINEQDINFAFTQLDSNDFVLGPALDGGYYLIGMKELSPTLFSNMAWSTANVLSDSILRIKEKQSSYFLLEAKSDIDFEEDLERKGYVSFNL